MNTAKAPSRRTLVALLLGAGMAPPFKARSEPEIAPPRLMSATSQFIELRPLAEAPPLKLERIDGRIVDLRSLRRKIVLLSFWATWCPPCRRELPALERLAQTVAASDVEVVAVSVDQAGKPAVSAFLDRVGVKRLRPFVDPQGRLAGPPSEAKTAPSILYGMPISYVIDRQGRVAGYIAGEVDWTSQDSAALLRHYADAEP